MLSSRPSLPSQSFLLDVPQELRNKSYADGSFIESVNGGVITIRDPKHDARGMACRLELFVLK